MTEQNGPDLVAAIDQMGAYLRSSAQAVGAYRNGLIDVGIPDEVADAIVHDYATRAHALLFPSANPFEGLGGIFGNG